MNYRVRVVLDTDEDVIRDIELNGENKLNTLHESIISAFDLYKGEMASFFISNKDWEQGKEISLVNFGNSGDSELMAQKQINQVMPEKGTRMIYVYDFLNLWTFFLEVVAIEEKDTLSAPLIHQIQGMRPSQAPVKMMESTNLADDSYFEEGEQTDNEDNWEDSYYEG